MSTYNWSNDDIMVFLEAYKAEPIIWNTKDSNHKDKKKVADAWARLSQSLRKTVKDLKGKKEILMTTFRKHFKRKQESISVGAGTEDKYHPSWFAFEFMESFLLPIYAGKYLTTNTETSQQNLDETDSENGDREMNDTSSLDNEPIIKPTPTPTQILRPRRPASNLDEQQMAPAFGQLISLDQQFERSAASEDDECDLYSKLLARKLRALPTDDRLRLMYQIDGLFINRLNCNRGQPSPQYSWFVKPQKVWVDEDEMDHR